MPASPRADLAPRKRPVQARARARVRRILEATRELVESGPLEAVTTTRIAERAGMPVGSLYQYFPHRLAVLAELARQVLDETDRVTLEALEATGELPWREAVDRVVDGTLEAQRRASRCAALFRAVPPTPEFRAIAGGSNDRLARGLAAHPVLRGCGLAPAEIQRVARVAIEAADAIQRLVLDAPTPDEASALAEEMKRLLKAYLAVYVEEPGAHAARPPAAHPAPKPTEDRP